ncbi:MAG: alpha-mannosidase [Lachnospiraceae bacterium]|nr:alpha-mannosidase [Lachnospiraceae bacterium]
MKTIVHVISHSHWDREWYMAFEQHRIKLVDLIDQSMELFEKDAAFSSFHLDGQTIVMDDYLEIKPQNRERLKKHVREGRFSAGPWYILQDEFLTSGEANVRNLLVGRAEALEYGGLCPVGYFPDAFGNAGQMPQLLKQAGMKAVVFGRGVKPVGFNNEVQGGEYESMYSEMMWESPDGSALPGILFANWYSNGIEIPVEEEAAKVYWEEKLAGARRFAGTRHLLLMNGCDHQPVQRDLGAALETARKLYPDIEFIHSDFNTYVDAVSRELKNVSTVRGELISQETDGRFTLVNTTSSHIPLKQMNRVCETALEKEAEPMAALASLCGKAYPEELLRYSWKTLMQNHPHDSICGCSVDPVNEEIKIRFDKSRQVAKELFADSCAWMADRIHTETPYPIVVFNTTGWNRSGMAEVMVDYKRSYGGRLTGQYEEMERLQIPELVLKDADGNEIAATIRDAGVSFGYELPEDRFRQPYMARQLKVTFEAENVPALGYCAYRLEEASGTKNPDKKRLSLTPAKQVMENAFLRVEIHGDGSYSVTEKESGKHYPRIGYYQDCGDIGNEYIFIQDSGMEEITTLGTEARVRLIEDEPYRCTYQIDHKIMVPDGADELLDRERRQCVDLYERKAGRSTRLTELAVTTLLRLERGAKGLKVETTIHNTAKDHRVRVMIPTNLQAQTHFADSTFEVVERPNRHGKAWQNPSGCEHQQNFVAMDDGTDGILVANFGLYEYEVLPDRDNTIAVTLLRCTGEMGDWGDFPTPAAQLPGTHTVAYEIVPYKKEAITEAFTEGHLFQTELGAVSPASKGGYLKAQSACAAEKTLPPRAGFFTWSGKGLNLTGFKKKDGARDIVIRFVNETKETAELTIESQGWFGEMYHSNVIEERIRAAVPGEDGRYHMTVKPFEIFTIGIVPDGRKYGK